MGGIQIPELNWISCYNMSILLPLGEIKQEQ